VLLPLRDGQIRALNNADRPSAARTELAAQVAEGGEAIQVSGSGLGVGIDNILCVPIRGRHEKVRAVAQVVNKRGGASFTPADERAFRDLAGPLGLIVEAYQRVAQLD